jgi:uncharacterized membrane protein HdeD (DUF308 family)
MAEHMPMPMCPMAETCRSMMSRSRPGTMLLIPGIMLILLGLAVIIEPRLLVWLIGLSFIAMGCMVLICSRFMRGFSDRLQGFQGS